MDGKRLFEIYRSHMSGPLPVEWDELPPQMQADWVAFAETLTIDHGLVDNA